MWNMRAMSVFVSRPLITEQCSTFGGARSVLANWLRVELSRVQAAYGLRKGAMSEGEMRS